MQQSSRRSSDTHPIRIDSVQPNAGWALIGMSFCPGKKQVDSRSGRWHRDLASDLTRVQQWGASLVIPLIEDHEFEELQVKQLPDDVRRLGMKWRHLPNRDSRRVPAD